MEITFNKQDQAKKITIRVEKFAFLSYSDIGFNKLREEIRGWCELFAYKVFK